MPRKLRLRKGTCHDAADFCDVTHVDDALLGIERQHPARGSVGMFLRGHRAEQVLVVERRDHERVVGKSCFPHGSLQCALSVKCGTSIAPPLIVSTSGSVDQMKCCTPASFATFTAASACLDSSRPASQALVTRKTP